MLTNNLKPCCTASKSKILSFTVLRVKKLLRYASTNNVPMHFDVMISAVNLAEKIFIKGA